MKKLFSFVCVLCAAMLLSAKETIVWTGNEPISWNSEVYAGTQYETPEGTFTGLQKDYTVRVAVVAAIEEPQYVLTYKAGDTWEWTDLNCQLSTVNTQLFMSYTVESDQIATEIAERGLIFRGQGYDITSIIIDDHQSEEPEHPAEPALPGAYETILWQGDSAISWNPEEYAGGEFETAADLFAELQKEDTIRVYTAQAIEGAQYNLTYKAGDAWDWTELDITAENGVMSYVVLSETIAKEIAERGLVVRGQGYHMTYITVTAHSADTVTPVDPQPADSINYTGMAETVVWTGDIAISWNSEEYAGDKLDTRNVSETMFAGLQEGNIIRITYAEAAEDAQFGLQYKAGDDWAWTDLTVVAEEGGFAYKVASDEIAMLIADRGLVVTGIKYHATKISVFAPGQTEAIDQVPSDHVPSTKVLRNGQLLIIHGDKTYTVYGQNYK